MVQSNEDAAADLPSLSGTCMGWDLGVREWILGGRGVWRPKLL